MELVTVQCTHGHGITTEYLPVLWSCGLLPIPEKYIYKVKKKGDSHKKSLLSYTNSTLLSPHIYTYDERQVFMSSDLLKS